MLIAESICQSHSLKYAWSVVSIQLQLFGTSVVEEEDLYHDEPGK